MLALALALAAQGAGNAAVGATESAGCGTHGLSFELHGSKQRYTVVGLHAQGVGCATARGVAARVAEDLLRGRGISISGAVGFAMTQQSCTGCGAGTTSVSISYPRGKITLSLRGSGSSTLPAPTPGLPSTGQPGPVI
jgi:hypothetical protein